MAVDMASVFIFLPHDCYPAIVHRDVKASNVFLAKERKARVMDLGLARMVGDGDSHMSLMIVEMVGGGPIYN